MSFRKDEGVAKRKDEEKNYPKIVLMDPFAHKSLPKTLYYSKTLYFPFASFLVFFLWVLCFLLLARVPWSVDHSSLILMRVSQAIEEEYKLEREKYDNVFCKLMAIGNPQ